MKKTEYFVDREWLIQHLNDPQVVIVDCRFQLADSDWGEREYRSSHIAGAYYLNLDRDLSSEIQRHGGRHPLPDMNVLAQKFAQLGIVNTAIRDASYPEASLAVKNETLVVAYDNSRFAFASRFWWLLRYVGHEQAVLLDGGWNDWICLLYTSPSPRDLSTSRMPSSA